MGMDFQLVRLEDVMGSKQDEGLSRVEPCNIRRNLSSVHV